MTGESIPEASTWIYPFKHLVFYEPQIVKFLELLNGLELETCEAKDLVPTVTSLAEEMWHSLGTSKQRSDAEYADINIAAIMRKQPDFLFGNHFRKVEQNTSNGQGAITEELKKETGLGNMGSTEGYIPYVDDPGLLGDVGASSKDDQSGSTGQDMASQAPNPQICTCLRNARDHLQLLVKVLHEYLGDLLTLRRDISGRSLKKIGFEHLWHLYKAGDLVVSSKQPFQAYRVIHVGGGRSLMTMQTLSDDAQQDRFRKSGVSPFAIDCVRFDFDGEKFGPVQETISISEFDEEKVITELNVYPMAFAEDEVALRRMLTERGQRFVEFNDFQHKRYSGLSLGDPQEEVRDDDLPFCEFVC